MKKYKVRNIVISYIFCFSLGFIFAYYMLNINENRIVNLLSARAINYENKLSNSMMELEEKQSEYKKIKESLQISLQKVISDNNDLAYQNAMFEDTVLRITAMGIRPQNYDIPNRITSRGSYVRNKDRLKYVGEWLGTYYCPNKKETGNNKGITKSGKFVQPGRTIAVDTKYWKLGTKFYIEGIGCVTALDIGSAIKGRNRFDLCVFSEDISNSGNFKTKVYLIEEK
jgi:3D (Asp-Asp-Asp) domain-containing protein